MIPFFSDARLHVSGRIDYLIGQKDQIPAIAVASVTAYERWPNMVINFMLQKIEFSGFDETYASEPKETQAPIGDPIQISCKI